MVYSPLEVLSGKYTESEIKDVTETVDDGEFLEDYGYSSDSDLEEDWDFGGPAPPPVKSQPQPGALYGEYKELFRMGKVIRIRDVAYITCVFSKSILLPSQLVKASKRSCYIYTLIRSASPLSGPKKIGSQGVLKSPGPKKEKYKNHRPNQSIDWQTKLRTLLSSLVHIVDCSVQYDVPELKRTALKRIKSGLGKCDIVKETFSVFASRCASLLTSK